MDIKDTIRECYAIEDNDQAMSCIRREIKEVTEGCKPQMVLLVKEGCPGCKESKAAYKDDIRDGLVKTVDVRSEEGIRIAKRNDITTVPAFLILDCEENAIV